MDNRLKTESLEKWDFNEIFEGGLFLGEALSLVNKAWRFEEDKEGDWEEDEEKVKRKWGEWKDWVLCTQVLEWRGTWVCMGEAWEIVLSQQLPLANCKGLLVIIGFNSL